jgi:hypothetical protein
MLQCPHCDSRVFEAGLHSAASVRITGLDNGDYDEQEIESYNREWLNLQCCRCEQYCDEEAARHCFEVASLYDETRDEVYDFYDTRSLTAPTAVELDCLYTIAAAWNLSLWKQERTPEGAQHV